MNEATPSKIWRRIDLMPDNIIQDLIFQLAENVADEKDVVQGAADPYAAVWP